MTGLRGNPCENLFTAYKLRAGESHTLCHRDGIWNENPIQDHRCKVGEYCPLIGDKKYGIVMKNET
jgi:hypothetical protein